MNLKASPPNETWHTNTEQRREVKFRLYIWIKRTVFFLNICFLSIWSKSVWFIYVLTLRGRLYRRRYQLVYFKTSAKDIKNTPSILVVQISVIHQFKLWSVYFFCVHSQIQQNFVVLEKKKKTNRMRSLSSPSPRAALQKTSLKWTVTQRKLNTRTWELYL